MHEGSALMCILGHLHCLGPVVEELCEIFSVVYSQYY